MKLSKLKPNDFFKSYSGAVFQVLEMTAYEKKNNKDRIKAQRQDDMKIYFLAEMVVIKYEKEKN